MADPSAKRANGTFPPVDVVIVNYNSTDYLLSCIRSIYRVNNGNSLNIYVEDNGSVDGVERVSREWGDVNLSVKESNEGYSRSVNDGLKKSRAPYVVLLNPDTVLNPGFFGKVIRCMEEDPAIGVLGPRILNPDGTIQGSARSFPTALTALFGRNSLLTRWFPDNPISRRNMLHFRSDGKTPMAVDWVSGACMVVRKEALERVGVLDERFFMYWEDVDLCRRMGDGGWKVVYDPGPAVVHHVGGSSGKLLFRSVYEFHKSCYRLVMKNSRIPKGILAPVLLPLLAARLGAVLLYHAVMNRK